MSSPADDGERSPAPIRSYVLRRSHFSPAQRQAYERLMPVFGVPYRPTPLNLPEVFGREAETVLEIGFGMGDTTAEIAASHPARDYLAVDVHTPGVGALLKLVEAQGLTNVRIIEHDAREVVEHQIPDDYLTGINVFFPDPWPKARHHKRRLIRTQFVHTLATKLRVGGFLHLATDWPDYAEQMVAAVDETPNLHRLAGSTDLAIADSDPATGADPTHFQPTPVDLPVRPSTRFEKRGQRLGHPIADIVAIRTVGMAANI